jgi:hypothetical protein
MAGISFGHLPRRTVDTLSGRRRPYPRPGVDGHASACGSYSTAGALLHVSGEGNTVSSEYRVASPAGVYFLKVQTDDGIIHTAKVFVN